MTRKASFSLYFFQALYFGAWLLALPFLFFVKRLRPISRQRFGLGMPSGPFDLWIHASSVGEARLALQVLGELPRERFPKVIVSSNTSSGMQVLESHADDQTKLVFFSFDFLPSWSIALARVQPRRILLLETEIWPALLFYCRQRSIDVTIGNARMSLKSFCRYYPLSGLFSQIKPVRILSVSEKDNERFSWIFSGSDPEIMSNIKFDTVSEASPVPYVKNPLASYFKPGHPLIVLGSIRKEEEIYMRRLVKRVSSDHPKTTIALFPRHMERIKSWQEFLENEGIPWSRRSDLENRPSLPGVILWDMFGELVYAYALAKSVYVGGSLAPCGGQNFLEPLSQGIVPCVGPFWDNFEWVGQEIVSSDLLCRIEDERELYARLIKPPSVSKDRVFSDFNQFIQKRQGGTRELIKKIQ